MPYSEYLQDGIFQIRAQQLLYFFNDGKKVILTNGFTKKTPKTPPAEIYAEYEQREAEK